MVFWSPLLFLTLLAPLKLSVVWRCHTNCFIYWSCPSCFRDAYASLHCGDTLRKVGTRHLCIFVVWDFWATWWVPADIGSSFTSGFFRCCPLMCLMCCSFYFQKLKLKADSRSLFLFPTGYCTKCHLSYQNEKTENVHLESCSSQVWWQTIWPDQEWNIFEQSSTEHKLVATVIQYYGHTTNQPWSTLPSLRYCWLFMHIVDIAHAMLDLMPLRHHTIFQVMDLCTCADGHISPLIYCPPNHEIASWMPDNQEETDYQEKRLWIINFM